MTSPTRTFTFAPAYPTPQHERSAQRIVEFFSGRAGVEAVLLTCSCARGRATPESCLDICILTRPGLPAAALRRLEADWEACYNGEDVFKEMRALGKFTHVDLELWDGSLHDHDHGHTTGPDEFELEIGNLLFYSSPLWEAGSAYQELRSQWLPYYGEPLRQERLAMVTGYGLNNLDHIPSYVQRGLYFQAHKRLYHAFGEFLQALFISRRLYPIAYDKWIKEQVVEILGLPELYPQLTRLFEIRQFESGELAEKETALRGLYTEYIQY